MDTATIQELIRVHGYWALFVGGFIEGETFFLLGGMAAGQGLLNPWGVGLAAMAGGFLGDQFFFLLGLWRGNSLLKRFKRLSSKAKMAKRLVRRHAVLLILFSRFLYGLRAVIPFACGASKIKPLNFMILNLISAFLWSLTFGGLGYFVGGFVMEKMEMVTSLKTSLILISSVLLATFLLGRLIRKKFIKNSQEKPK